MNPTISLYTKLGGATVVQDFVNHLYHFMHTSNEVLHVRSMHSLSLDHANDRLFKFLSGMIGGPDLYTQEFGPPRLRRRHMGFSIGDKERDEWLLCANYAANQLDIMKQDRTELMSHITMMANHLRNQHQ